jgi:hypothetical protein
MEDRGGRTPAPTALERAAAASLMAFCSLSP